MKKLSTLLLALSSFAIGVNFVLPSTVYAADSNATNVQQPVLAQKQVLNFNFTSIGTIDPTQLQWSDDFALARMLWDTLIRQNNQGEFVPSAAQSYSVSPDGLVWTFKLRKDAKWSDGKPVTAQDFVYSWQRLADPNSAAPYSYYLPLMNLKNADAVISGKAPVSDLGVKAVDDYTFQVTLDKPTPWFTTMIPLSVLAPLRKDIIEKYGKAWTNPKNIVTNGPFDITSYRINDVVELKRNPLYWNAQNNKITNIVIDFVSEPTASYYGYLSGKYQTGGIPPALKSVAFKDHHRELIYATKNSIDYLLINDKAVPDVNVRKAISMLVNRRVYTSKILKFGIPTTTIAPVSIEDGQDLREREWFNEPYSQRVAEARALVAKAGYTKQKPLVLEYLTDSPKSDKFFIALQNWLYVGTGGAIQVKIKGVESRVFNDLVAQRRYQITTSGWNADYPQVSTFLTQYTCNNNISSVNFCNKEFDKLLAQANNSDDPKTRQELYAKAQDILADQYLVSGLEQVAGFFLKSPKLQGYNPYLPYRYYNDYYILKDIPECYTKGGDSMCATDLSKFYKETGFKPIPVPAENPYK